MLKYIGKRILIFIPTLIVITLLGFVISINAPGDPIERMVVAAQSGGEVGTQSVSQIEQKRFWRQKLGLDLPVFYFSLNSLSRPDTLYKVFDKNERETLDRLISKYGNWETIQEYHKAVSDFQNAFSKFQIDTNTIKTYDLNAVNETINQIKFESLSLKSSYDHTIIESKFNKLYQLISYYPFLSKYQEPLGLMHYKYIAIETLASPWKNYIPKLSFYSKNQYHRWVFGDGNWITGKDSKFSKGLIRGDFGTSYVTKQPISEVISSKIGWSLFFSMLSLILAYVISIPIGVKSAAKKGSRYDKIVSVILFMLYSMPGFWIATILLMTFANPDIFQIFPASGVKPATGYPEMASLWEKIKISFPYIVLPAICYTYGSFAFISRTMRVSMIEIVGQDYIRTARAKGLPEKVVIWKHAFRNSLLPIITIFANIFPAAIGGSVIFETIFTIPGMGYESIFAIQNQNYPMIIAILTITGFLTLVGYLVSDILYALVDPRISYSK